MINIYAGNSALNTISKEGFSADLFTNFLGASGGPKWFTLFGLDKYIFGEFFKHREDELNLIGSSAGAFRSACFAQDDPVAAIKRLAYSYSETVYSDKPTTQEITNKAIDIVDHIFGSSGALEVVNNKMIKSHFIVSKCEGLTSIENKLAQGAGLLSSMLLNKIDRKLLAFQYQRYIFKSSTSNLAITDPYNIPTNYTELSSDNIKQALLASGSIPMIMSGVKNIPNVPQGTYRDGGIIDYHFDITLQNKKEHSDSLTLYPHFNAMPKAGWFDKRNNREVSQSNYSNTVLLVPSDEFVSALPYQKIPDRTDFETMDAKTLINYWKKVLGETDRLAEEFHDFLHKQELSVIKPFQAKG
jgi:hypothetical protein